MYHAQEKKHTHTQKNFPTSRSLYMGSSGLENKSMIIHFLSIPTLSQPFSTVSSLFRMYSSIPCGQALLSAGRFFCGTKEEVIIIAKNIAMYLKLNLNGHINSTRRLHSLWFLLFFNGHLPLFQWLVVIVPRFGNSIVQYYYSIEVALSDVLGKLKTFPQPKVAVFRGMLLIRREFKRAFVK